MGCDRDRGRPPTVAQWVERGDRWRLYWACGCVKYLEGVPRDTPPCNARVLPEVDVATGSGDVDPYLEAVAVLYENDPVIH